jgi:RHH-type rel operon transcriptional repressor/antitoxin RelB
MYSGGFALCHSPLEFERMLAIRLPEDIEVRLEKLAKRTGRSKTFYARQAIVEYLDDLEDLYLAEQRWLSLQRGESLTVSLDEVGRELGLDD